MFRLPDEGISRYKRWDGAKKHIVFDIHLKPSSCEMVTNHSFYGWWEPFEPNSESVKKTRVVDGWRFRKTERKKPPNHHPLNLPLLGLLQ